jgi:HPt (histidine-containing phosphotransfer) domain-containing protein
MTTSATSQFEESNDLQDIDLTVLDFLLSLKKPGAPDPRKRIIAIYLESAPKLMDSIRGAFAASDSGSLRKAAHSLKSSSYNVGANGLGSICGELEQLAKAGPLDDEGGLMDRAETSFKAVIASLEEALRRMSQ